MCNHVHDIYVYNCIYLCILYIYNMYQLQGHHFIISMPWRSQDSQINGLCCGTRLWFVSHRACAARFQSALLLVPRWVWWGGQPWQHLPPERRDNMPGYLVHFWIAKSSFSRKRMKLKRSKYNWNAYKHLNLVNFQNQKDGILPVPKFAEVHQSKRGNQEFGRFLRKKPGPGFCYKTWSWSWTSHEGCLLHFSWGASWFVVGPIVFRIARSDIPNSRLTMIVFLA